MISHKTPEFFTVEARDRPFVTGSVLSIIHDADCNVFRKLAKLDVFTGYKVGGFLYYDADEVAIVFRELTELHDGPWPATADHYGWKKLIDQLPTGGSQLVK
ncbi:hypothetical protein AAFN60_12705 [Roseibacillus persicicus]|uniref:hypothetical protein n=1 Tax=Roseibacillus persicicus TaxID=454148 RepID=UPI00398A6EE4